jgi:DNA-binding response OmpR family regulator
MKKIFILDDNEELLEILTRLLSKEFDVFASSDTDNIILQITSFNPDILVLDHSIGEINSADIIHRLKLQHAGFAKPVVLFSAHAQLPQIASAVGADGYIDKPSDIAYIRNYIRKVLAV